MAEEFTVDIKLFEDIVEGFIQLRSRVEKLEQLVLPVIKEPIDVNRNQCPKCGISLQGLTGYVCNRSNCPCFHNLRGG